MIEKKKYVIPEAEIIDYVTDDIITLSEATEALRWGDDDNTEGM